MLRRKTKVDNTENLSTVEEKKEIEYEKDEKVVSLLSPWGQVHSLS